MDFDRSYERLPIAGFFVDPVQLLLGLLVGRLTRL
jgi:hypothetical protein